MSYPLQLNPSIPVLTPKGKGEAVLIIDYGPEHDLYWTVFLDEGGECWTFENKLIRGCSNPTIGRTSRPFSASNDLSWLCEICGDRRPDIKISVYCNDVSNRFRVPPGTVVENIRYCNDDPKCAEAAKTKTFLKVKA